MSFSVTTSFFHVFTPFFLCFWPVYNRSRVCRNTVEGLSTLVQGSVKAVEGRSCTFPIKICLLMASLVAHWSNTTQRFLRSTVFAAVSGKILSQTRSRIALLWNTWAAHRRRERGTGLGLRRGRSVRSFSKRWEIHQLHYCLQLHHFRRHRRTKICSVICCVMNPWG